jgi:hypothetical protein
MTFLGMSWRFGILTSFLSITGCPSNMCILTVNGRCSWSTCPDGAEFDNAKRTCVCAPNHFALGGGCLTQEAANRYCGKGAHFENGGCTANRCPPGFEIDQDTGGCISPQQTTQVATNMGKISGSAARQVSSWSSKGRKRPAFRSSKHAAVTNSGTVAFVAKRRSARRGPASIPFRRLVSSLRRTPTRSRRRIPSISGRGCARRMGRPAARGRPDFAARSTSTPSRSAFRRGRRCVRASRCRCRRPAGK